jgi:hypothetical protein
VPGGASGLLCRDYKGRNADRLVTRIDPGVVSLVAELPPLRTRDVVTWLSLGVSTVGANHAAGEHKRRV